VLASTAEKVQEKMKHLFPNATFTEVVEQDGPTAK
jgi:hypothetical protein